MNQRVQMWNAVMQDEGIQRGSPKELAFIRRHFRGVRTTGTFKPYMSKGFPEKYDAALRALFGKRYDPVQWLKQPQAGLRSVDHNRVAEWPNDPIGDMGDFCRQLGTLLGEATDYACLRVGGLSSRTRANVKLDETELAVEPEQASTRLPYLGPLWDRVAAGSLTITAVHVVRSIERLLELWAAVEILREEDRLGKNLVYAVPLNVNGLPRIEPTVSVRVINGRLTLLSLLRTEAEHTPPYSDWILSERLATFALAAITRVRQPGLVEELSALPAPALEEWVEAAVTILLQNKAKTWTNYGRLDTFDRVRIVKDRMLGWPRDLWLPAVG
ncbi:MAG TPA: hypothetical protein VF662_09590 [Allosphingosinicella sp.]